MDGACRYKWVFGSFLMVCLIVLIVFDIVFKIKLYNWNTVSPVSPVSQ